MKRLMRFLKPYWKWVLLAPLFMLVEVFMDLVQPRLMSDIVDVGIAGGDQGFIVATCLKMVGAALLGIVGGVGNMFFSTRAGYGFARDMRMSLYEKIQHFSFANIDRFKTGSLVTRVTNDVSQVQNAFQSCIRMLVRSPFLFLGGVVMIFTINAELAWLVMAAIPVLAAVIAFIMTKGFPLFRVAQEKLDRVNVVMQENLAGVRVIKAFGRSAYEKKRFAKSNDELMQTNMRAMRIMATSFPILNLIMNLTLIAMYWIGGNMVFEGTLSSGNVLAFASYITQILMSLMMSSFTLLFISRAKVSIDRIGEVLDTKIDINDEKHTDAKVKEGRVQFDDVSFRYPGQGGDPVLQHISFTAAPGSTVAILGSTGSGKTSLVSLIPRLYDVAEGRVLVDGVDVRDYQLDELRGAVGVALQESVLFTGDVAENLRWGDERASDELLRSMSDLAQADPFVQKMNDGYQTMLGQRGVNLSGGQKQRLCIARALVKQPKILILDDSTSAVDLNTEAEIQKNLRQVMSKCTVFIIAQRISAVMDADQIIVLDDGKIADIGKHDELKQRCKIYREIVESQLGTEVA